MCAQQKPRLACASKQSDWSLRCPPGEAFGEHPTDGFVDLNIRQAHRRKALIRELWNKDVLTPGCACFTKVAIDGENYTWRGSGRHSHKYRQLRADKDYTRFSFFPRTIIQWNRFPLSDLAGRVARSLQEPGREDRALQTVNCPNIPSLFFFLPFLIPSNRSHLFHFFSSRILYS